MSKQNRQFYGVQVDKSILTAFRLAMKDQGDNHTKVIHTLMLTYIQQSNLGPDALTQITQATQNRALDAITHTKTHENTPMEAETHTKTTPKPINGAGIRFKRT